MCGISGLICRGNKRFGVEEARLEQVLNKIGLRGPDSCRVERSDNFWVAHSLLDITSSKISQPTKLGNGDILVFNGEVYSGTAPFLYDDRSQPDTDFIVKTITYDNFFAFCEHLEGMFAIALYSPRMQRLKMARCSSGQKPLFYGFSPDMVAFSSTIETCSQLLNAACIDETTVAFSLRMGYPPPRRTIYKNIFSVAPGAGVEVCVGSGQVLQDISLSNKVAQSLAGFHPFEIVDDLSEAIPDPSFFGNLGLNLSGGLDSRMVLAAIKKKRGVGQLNIVSNRFLVDNPRYNIDSAEAIKFCRKEGLDLTILDVGVKDYTSNFCSAYLSVGQINSNLSVPTYYSQALLHKSLGSKVVLTGDGADEVLGGYEFYFDSIRFRRWIKYVVNQSPKCLSGLVFDFDRSSVNQELWQYFDYRKLYHSKHYLTGPEVTFEDFYQLVYADIGNKARELGLVGAASIASVRKIMLIDRWLWLSCESVPRTDNLYGNLGMEARSPFLLDRFLGDYLGNADDLRASIGIQQWKQKKLLKQRFDRSEIFVSGGLMQKKSGWTAPYKDWWLSGFKDLSIAITELGLKHSVPYVDWARLRQDISEAPEFPGKFIGAYLSYALVATGRSV